jgi:hypothetical protein
MDLRTSLMAVAVATAIGLATPYSATADMLVIESNVPDLKVGARLPDHDPVLPVGGRVKVLLRSNETKVYEHPRPGAESRSPTQPIGGTRNPE